VLRSGIQYNAVPSRLMWKTLGLCVELINSMHIIFVQLSVSVISYFVEMCRLQFDNSNLRGYVCIPQVMD
jgi:hypothetical protein